MQQICAHFSRLLTGRGAAFFIFNGAISALSFVTALDRVMLRTLVRIPAANSEGLFPRGKLVELVKVGDSIRFDS